MTALAFQPWSRRLEHGAWVPSTIPQSSAMTTLFASSTQTEIKALLKLAIPLISAQIAQAATGFVDTVMMGHLGREALAAGGLASFTFQVFLNVLAGIVMGVSPLVAASY